MNERPILMSAPMVRALLAGTKLQTRRAIKAQPTDQRIGGACSYDEHGEWVWLNGHDGSIVSRMGRCPYGQPGARLWVREAWRADVQFDAVPTRDIPPGPYFCEASRCNWEGGPHDGEPGRLRPGMFMPRWASRITLEVTEVRVERLQDISEADAEAEGSRDWAAEQETPARDIPGGETRLIYRQLWESINGPGSWDANPWCWAVSFKRVVG